MLKGISPLLGPELLFILQSMGHGDEIVIADANFPGASSGPALIRMDGISATDIVDAILSVMPLDTFAENAFRMEVVGAPDEIVPIAAEFTDLLNKHEPGSTLSSLERFDFYDRASEAFAVVQSGEARIYGNLILKKGVIAPE